MVPGVFADEELRAVSCPMLLVVGDKELIYDPVRALERAEDLLPKVTSPM